MARQWKDTDGTVASSDEFHTKGGARYTVVFTYKVEGSYYGGTFTTSTSYREGDLLTVQYDPAHPEINDLVQKEHRRRWLIAAVLVLIGIFFVVIFIANNVK